MCGCLYLFSAIIQIMDLMSCGLESTFRHGGRHELPIQFIFTPVGSKGAPARARPIHILAVFGKRIDKTKMRSSRMRTVRSSGRLPGDVCPYPPPPGQTTHPPPSRHPQQTSQVRHPLGRHTPPGKHTHTPRQTGRQAGVGLGVG